MPPHLASQGTPGESSAVSNKGMRRYKRHQEMHRAYFETLARQVVTERKTMVDLGVGAFEVRLRTGNRWLDIREPNGSWNENITNIEGLAGEALVSAITDGLIMKAAEFRGVEMSPSRVHDLSASPRSETLGGMASLRDRLDRCDAYLRERLEPDERVVAIGRCEDITARLGIDRGGAGWTFVMVTDRSLRWVPHVDLRFEARLDLAGVTSATERVVAHRYAIALEHSPIWRPWRVPAHRFLRFEWGNVIEVLSFGRTELAFSRRETEAAVALGEQLSMRGVLPAAEASHR
jgi:hypothetical protein